MSTHKRTQAPKGDELVTIPGGLEGLGDADLRVNELALLVKVDPNFIGALAVKGAALYAICANGLLEEVRA